MTKLNGTHKLGMGVVAAVIAGVIAWILFAQKRTVDHKISFDPTSVDDAAKAVAAAANPRDVLFPTWRPGDPYRELGLPSVGTLPKVN